MKWIYLGLVMAFTVLTILLFVRVEEEIRFGTQLQSYSWYYTDALETVQIETLVNDTESFYVDIEYIEQVSLKDETISLSMELVDLKKSDMVIAMQNHQYTVLKWVMRPNVIPANTTIQLTNAQMTVHYRNGDEIALNIGDVSYVFQQDITDDIALSELSATHEIIGDIETVSAVQIGLKNRTAGLLEIRSINVVSSLVSTNTGALLRDVDCQQIDSVSSCLGRTEYSFFITPIPSNLHQIILPGQDTTFYVPLSYQTAIPFHRFVIAVTYQKDGEEKIMYIDDFPFMKTTSFATDIETEYDWYVVD